MKVSFSGSVLRHILHPLSNPDCYSSPGQFFTQLSLVKLFSLETSLIWTVIGEAKLIPLVPDWHDFYGLKGECNYVQTWKRTIKINIMFLFLYFSQNNVLYFEKKYSTSSLVWQRWFKANWKSDNLLVWSDFGELGKLRGNGHCPFEICQHKHFGPGLLGLVLVVVV